MEPFIAGRLSKIKVRITKEFTENLTNSDRLTSGGSRKKIFGGPGPSSFGRQQRLSEIYYRTN